MAQEANGLVFNGANPTGVGAVYFDKTVDPVELQVKQLNDLDRAAQNHEQRNLAKKKLALSMAGDNNVDYKGIYEPDVPYFVKKGEDLTNLYANMLKSGVDPSNPAFLDAKLAYDKQLNQLKGEIEASKAHKGYALEAAKTYDPTKHDNRSLINQKQWRDTAFPDRMRLDPTMLNVWKKPSFYKTMQSFVKDLPKQQQFVRDEKGNIITENLPFGGKAYQEGKSVGFDELNTAVDDVFTDPNNPVTNEASEAFASLPTNEQQQFIDFAGKVGSDPIKEFIRARAHDANIMDVSLKEAKESAAYKHALKGSDAKQQALLFAEQLGNLKNGNPNVFQKANMPNVGTPSGTPTDVAQGVVGGVNALKGFSNTIGKGYSLAFQNQPVGKFTVYNSKGTPELKDVTVEMFKYDDGQGLKVKTNQTTDVLNQQGAGTYIGNAQVDEEGFIPFTDEMAITMAKSLGIPLDKLREVLNTNQGYKEKIMDFGPLGTKVTEVKKEVQPKVTPTEWNAKWAALKKGESLIGLDGKKYVKQ